MFQVVKITNSLIIFMLEKPDILKRKSHKIEKTLLSNKVLIEKNL